MLLPLTLIFFASIVLGMTGFTLELICEQDECCFGFVMLIFLPITMIAGIIKALGEMFCEAAGEICEEGL